MFEYSRLARTCHSPIHNAYTLTNCLPIIHEPVQRKKLSATQVNSILTYIGI
ncbi:hypothetical protein MADA3029_720034 [Vibrio nigripulchritudo MADA3029]|nr:hypothetical protein MADA3029_720034 [Vibrio nigripulchritudo MADA3029]